MTGRVRAFTLIEQMIAIALLAIFMAIGLNTCSLHWLQRESSYRFALRNARHQVGVVRVAPFDSLPPQTLPVGSDGWVQLSHPDLVPNSVQVLGAEIAVKQVDGARGRVQLSANPGTRVSVGYGYFLPDQGEAHTVPASSPYRIPLSNTPVLQLKEVRLAEGKVLPPSSYRLSGDFLELPSEWAGRVVEVDYSGARIRNQVWGSYLSADLQPISQPGPCKLIRIQESYGVQGRGRIDLNLIKVADRL